VKKITRRSQFPYCLRSIEEVKGICVGGCVDPTIEIMKRHAAHAHCRSGDLFQGWICVRRNYHTRFRLMMLHEAAHLIANKRLETPMHGRKWKQALVKLGGTFKPYSYKVGRFYHMVIDYTYRNTMR
jgi:hypothetical protein